MSQYNPPSNKRAYALSFRSVKCPACQTPSIFNYHVLKNPFNVEVIYLCQNTQCHQAFSLLISFDYLIDYQGKKELNPVFIEEHSFHRNKMAIKLQCPLCGQGAVIQKTLTSKTGDAGIYARCKSNTCKASIRLTRRFHRLLSLPRSEALYVAKLAILNMDDSIAGNVIQGLKKQPSALTDNIIHAKEE